MGYLAIFLKNFPYSAWIQNLIALFMHTQSKLMDLILNSIERLCISKYAVNISSKLFWFCQVPELRNFFLTSEVKVIYKVFQFIFNVLKANWLLNYCQILGIIWRLPERI